jgi:hypothetical protein
MDVRKELRAKAAKWWLPANLMSDHRTGRRRIRPIVALVALEILTLIGCESSGFAERQKNEINQSYVNCLKNEARRIDTGKAEAATIALAIWPACSRYFARLRDAAVRNEDATSRTELNSRFLLRDIDFATEIVVAARSEKATATDSSQPGSGLISR